MSLARDGRKLALVRSSEISCPRGLTRFSSVPLSLCHPERSGTISWPLTKGMGSAVAGSRGIIKVQCCRKEFSPCLVPLNAGVSSCRVRNGKHLAVSTTNDPLKRILQARNVRLWRSRENSLGRHGKGTHSRGPSTPRPSCW